MDTYNFYAAHVTLEGSVMWRRSSLASILRVCSNFLVWFADVAVCPLAIARRRTTHRAVYLSYGTTT